MYIKYYHKNLSWVFIYTIRNLYRNLNDPESAVIDVIATLDGLSYHMSLQQQYYLDH
jgi:hypothetical protein